MVKIIRTIGLLNAAIWFGTAVFFTAGVAPAFFSTKMLSLFGGETSFYSRAYAGWANIIVLERYFYWQYVCGGIALCHLVFEWFYGGQLISRFKPGILALVCSINLISGIFLMPQIKQLHIEKYDVRSGVARREAAASSFKILHGISWGLNLIVIAGTGAYFYILTNQAVEHRLVLRDKFRY